MYAENLKIIPLIQMLIKIDMIFFTVYLVLVQVTGGFGSPLLPHENTRQMHMVDPAGEAEQRFVVGAGFMSDA